MALKHSVYDTDAHFKIDPITHAIKNDSVSKTVLIQHDHNSERFTFEIPRMIDGHDMSKCDVVQIHYINIDAKDKNKTSKDAHDLDDLQISPDGDDVVICSWLIDGKATQYAGSLNFLLKFKCIGDDGSVCYVGNTAIFAGLAVSPGIDNTGVITGEYSDILEQWRHELVESGGVTDARIAQAVEDYMVEHPNGTGGGTTTETITETGTVVNIEVDKGAKLTVKADTAETVTLIHHGKNYLPSIAQSKSEPDYSAVLNEDGTVHFTGTPATTRYIDFCGANRKIYLPAGSYLLTGSPTKNIKVWLQKDGASEGFASLIVNDSVTRTQFKFTLSEGCYIRGFFEIKKEVTYDETLWCQIVAWDTGDPVPEYEPSKRVEAEASLPVTVDALAGTNILYTTTGDTLTVSTTKEVPNKESGSFDATVWGMPVLTLDGDCTGMTKDDYVNLAFTFQGMSGNVDVKKQGSSSITTGEQIGKDFDTDLGGLFNFTLKFPEAFEAKTGWGAQKKYCFKANAIDHSHARNVCSCKLWGQIVKSRANVPAELSSLPNGGAIDGFPIIVVLNGKYYALGTFNIPKDKWMFGNPKAILCADVHSNATKFKALATLDGDFELEYVEDENNADWVLTSINTAIQAVMNSNGSDLDTTVGQYIDIPSAIDYYIHTVDENADDGTDKNYILVTFDGVKWYFSAYDRDTVYGLNWDGKSINYPLAGIDYANYAEIHQLMHLIYMYARPALKARAVELRQRIKAEYNVANVFTNFAAGIPSEVFAQNAKRWPLLRSTSVSNTAQILNWYRLRRASLDARIDAWNV